jgi:pyrrolidone-carboxylate peptidase
MNGLFVLVQNRQRSGGRCVVAIERRIANVIDQRIGDAQHRNEIVNPTVLRESSAHG